MALLALGVLLTISSLPASASAHQHRISTKTLSSLGVKPAIFSPSVNVWRQNVRRAPVAANSSALVTNLNNQVVSRYNGVAAFNVNAFNNAFVTADANTSPQRIQWDDCQHRGYVPDGLYNGENAFMNVPVPATAVAAPGTDGELSIWQPSSDTLWEFWQIHRDSDGWHACWGGRIDNYSQSSGQFPQWFGVSASGLALADGSVGILEARSGHIRHAIYLSLPETANYAKYSYPATRSDGSLPLDDADAIQQGQRFRLDPKVKLQKLHLSPTALAVARAAKRYGFIVADTSGAVAIDAEDGTRVQQLTGVDPWASILHRQPSYEVLRHFPWRRLQALPIDYGKP